MDLIKRKLFARYMTEVFSLFFKMYNNSLYRILNYEFISYFKIIFRLQFIGKVGENIKNIVIVNICIILGNC